MAKKSGSKHKTYRKKLINQDRLNHKFLQKHERKKLNKARTKEESRRKLRLAKENILDIAPSFLYPGREQVEEEIVSKNRCRRLRTKKIFNSFEDENMFNGSIGDMSDDSLYDLPELIKTELTLKDNTIPNGDLSYNSRYNILPYDSIPNNDIPMSSTDWKRLVYQPDDKQVYETESSSESDYEEDYDSDFEVIFTLPDNPWYWPYHVVNGKVQEPWWLR
jgi:hypothetical protein